MKWLPCPYAHTLGAVPDVLTVFNNLEEDTVDNDLLSSQRAEEWPRPGRPGTVTPCPNPENVAPRADG